MRRWDWAGTEAPGALAPSAPPVVWAIDLDACPAAALAEAPALMSAGERRRAAAFRAPVDGRRFTASRLALRRILGAHAGARPEALAFQRQARGKPALPGGPAFSLSHSGRHLLVAVHACDAVGVDVEAAVPGFAIGEVAARVLTPREQVELAAAAPAERVGRFIRAWTLKEAVLKATGEGLSREMAELEVALDPPSLRAAPASYPAPAGWRLRAWAYGDAVGALAWAPGVTEV